MECFHPICISLTEEEQARRARLSDEYPLWYRMATKVYVPCGKCEACAMKRRNEWMVRLRNEVANCQSCYFVTLTYDDDHLPFNDCMVPVVNKRDCQNFLKRLRKRLYPFKIRYFLVSEYGPTTYRPHYHMILFNFPNHLKNEIIDVIDTAWQNGFTTIAPINGNRIGYVCSYCLDSSTLPQHLEKNFMLCSKRPAIGGDFLDDDVSTDYLLRKRTYKFAFNDNGESRTYSLPRYYRDKLFDKDIREQISLQNIEYYAEEYKREQKLQADWLIKHNIPVNQMTLRSAYVGSPLYTKKQCQEMFKKRVQNKNKMNKKKI